MNTKGFRGTMMGSASLLWLVLRHMAAPLVSFVVSYAAAFVLAIPLGFIGMTLRTAGQGLVNVHCVAVFFCGVFCGARCLPRATRRIGSLVLVLLGLIYFYYFVATWGDQKTDEGTIAHMNGLSWARLVSLGIGGLLATVVIWATSRKKLLEPPMMAAIG